MLFTPKSGEKKVMKKNLIVYLPVILAVFIVKIYYRTADSDMLLWILAPTTSWVRILSGIPFEYVSKVGYISHEYRFIIAPSCSGVRFLLLTFVMMTFSFTNRIDLSWKKVCWLGLSAVFSYLSTVFVNGIRIAVSIYLPFVLMDRNLMSGWLTSERLHTIIGTAIYFSMLFAIYYLAGAFCKHFVMNAETEQRYVSNPSAETLIGPVFWYFTMVLGLPFAVRFYRNDWEGFLPYALLVTGVCVFIAFLLFLFRYISFHLHN